MTQVKNPKFAPLAQLGETGVSRKSCGLPCRYAGEAWVSRESGERPADLIRAEMVMFETAHGGGVFATGSITWCGALPVDNYDNDASRIMVNVLRRFSERG